MNKKITISVFLILMLTVSLHAQVKQPNLLRDGSILRGASGKLIASDSNDSWFFQLSNDTSENGTTLKAGTKLQMLPSSALELMIEHVKNHVPATYQLWNAKITKYKGNNYIFPSVFVPVNPPEEPSEPNQTDIDSDTNQNQSDENSTEDSITYDANDPLALPPEVLKQFNAAREEMLKTGQRISDSNIITIENAREELEVRKRSNPDSVLLDKTAILINKDNDFPEFNIDSLGRNLEKETLKLLPCEILELTEAKTFSSPDPLRFKISGIVTNYKGQKYLLLYKATQIYSHGNFGR